MKASVNAVRRSGLEIKKRPTEEPKIKEEKVSTQKTNTATISGRGYA